MTGTQGLSINHHQYTELRERVMQAADTYQQSRGMKVLGNEAGARAVAQAVLDAALHELGIWVTWPETPGGREPR